MEIRVNLATKSYPYIREDSLDVKGIIICTAKYNRFDDFFTSVNKSGVFGNKCPHYYIDGEGKVYQVLPENYKAKYAGKKIDDNYLQIVVQEPKGVTIKSPNQFGVVSIESAQNSAFIQYKTLVKLCTTLCIRHSLEPDNKFVLISQYEAYNSGLANKSYGIEHIWKGLNTRMFMSGLRINVGNDLTEGKGYYHDGVDYSFVFDPDYYDRMYPETGLLCEHNHGRLFKHFIEIGMSECRKGNEDFDVVVYIQSHPNLNFGDNWPEYYRHYCEIGRLEN